MTASVEDLFDRFHLAIYRYLLRMTGRPDVAEDLTQDVFVRVVRAARGDLAGGERAWLFEIARNLLVDWQRRARRNPVSEDTEALSARGADGAAARQDVEADVREALGRLPDADREVFLLRVIGGLGHEEIAAISGTSAASVRSRIFRARSALRASLGEARPATGGPADVRRFKARP